MLWSKPPDPKDPKNPEASRDSKTPPAIPSTAPSPKNPSQTGTSEILDDIVEGYAPDSTESNVRYAAYATRIKTILGSAHRYVAYTSDIGESFRPIAHPNFVRAAYGVSWLYILGDVGYEGYKAYLHNERMRNPHRALNPSQAGVAGVKSPASDATGPRQTPAPGNVEPKVVPPLEDYRTVMLQRGIFQSIASMGLPAFTIHSVVRYSGRAIRGVKSPRLQAWGPIGLGLSVVPFLPAIFDEPVENAVEWMFHKGFEAYGGREYVGSAPTTGREDLLSQRPGKEKEL